MSKDIKKTSKKKSVVAPKEKVEVDEKLKRYKEVIKFILDNFPKNGLKGDTEFMFYAIAFNPKTGDLNKFGCGQASLAILKLLANEAQRRVAKLDSSSPVDKMLVDVLDAYDAKIKIDLIKTYGVQNN